MVQFGLYIITLGLFGVFWFYSTMKELEIANGKEERALLWTFLLIVPIANLFSVWHYASEVGVFTRDKYPGILIFLLWLVFSPVVWLLVQMELNSAAKGTQGSQSATPDPA